MNKINPCMHCGKLPTEEKKITEPNGAVNIMYSYRIFHECGGITKSHLTLFFKNKLTKEECEKILNESSNFYREQWNKQNPIDKVIGM